MLIARYLTIAIFIIAINITDLKEYKIKNKAVLVMIVIGFVLNIIDKCVLDGLYGMVIPLVLFPLYALRMLGAGDIKALCAIGVAFGLSGSVKMMAFTFVCGGVIALFFMIFRKNGLQRMKYFFNYLKTCFLARSIQKYNFGGDDENNYFRFSYAIAAGAVLTIANNYICII